MIVTYLTLFVAEFFAPAASPNHCTLIPRATFTGGFGVVGTVTNANDGFLLPPAGLLSLGVRGPPSLPSFAAAPGLAARLASPLCTALDPPASDEPSEVPLMPERLNVGQEGPFQYEEADWVRAAVGRGDCSGEEGEEERRWAAVEVGWRPAKLAL